MRALSESRRAVTLGFLAVFLAVLMQAEAFPDGAYIPDAAFAKPSEIPRQRAVIVYRDGSETLVVQSALESEAQAMGWIIPLPTAPSEFAKATPGMLDTLYYATGPEITHDRSEELTPRLYLAVTFLAFALPFFLRPNRWIRPLILVTFIYACMVPWFTTAPLSAPTDGASGAQAGARKAREINRVDVGGYELSVLEASDAAALDDWLSASGYAKLPAEARPTVEDYIKNGWVFVTARLRRDGKGYSEPHPLSMTFAAAEPVYPMRLTALSGVPLDLTLYVIADGRAEIEGLDVDFCDEFRLYPWPPDEPAYDGEPHLYEAANAWDIFSYQNVEVAHPDLVKLMWDTCVITSLSGKPASSDMQRDYRVAVTPFAYFRTHLYSGQGALQTGLMLFVVPWAVCVSAGVVIGRKRIAAPRGRIWAAKRIIAPSVLILAAAVFVTHLVLPTVPVDASEAEDVYMIGQSAHHSVEKAFSSTAVQGRSLDEIRAEVREFFARTKELHPLTGEPLREGDSPGDYMVYEDERGVVFRAFTMSGYPLDCVLKEAARSDDEADVAH